MTHGRTNVYCVQCGASIPDNARFCSSCGTSQSQSNVQSQSPVAGGLDSGKLLQEAQELVIEINADSNSINEYMVMRGYNIYGSLLEHEQFAAAALYSPLKHCWVAHHARTEWLNTLSNRATFESIVNELRSSRVHLVDLIGSFISRDDLSVLPDYMKLFLVRTMASDVVGLSIAFGIDYLSFRSAVEKYGTNMLSYALKEAHENSNVYRQLAG